MNRIINRIIQFVSEYFVLAILLIAFVVGLLLYFFTRALLGR